MQLATPLQRMLAAVLSLSLLPLSLALAPAWPPTWKLQSSTIIQPCNYSGMIQPIDFYAQFAVVDIDWSCVHAR